MNRTIIGSVVAGSLWLGASAALWVSIPLVMGDTAKIEEPEPHYNPTDETTVWGIVLGTQEVSGNSPIEGLYVQVNVKGQEVESYLGPADFIRDFGITFSKGESICIIGAKVTSRGKRFILAREIAKGGTVLYLRDQKGRPNWHRDAT